MQLFINSNDRLRATITTQAYVALCFNNAAVEIIDDVPTRSLFPRWKQTAGEHKINAN